jgi:hypothetical protein
MWARRSAACFVWCTLTAGAAEAQVVGAPRPAVVTKAFIRELATDLKRLQGLVDPALGVADVAYIKGECVGDEPCSAYARRLCGHSLDRRLASLKAELPSWIRYAELDGFTCRNRPDVVCTLQHAGEGAVTLELRFRSQPDGLVLERIFERNRAYRNLGRERRYLKKALATVAESCPAATPR